MNHAYVDASWQEQPPGPLSGWGGVGGWGLVLLRPSQLPQRIQGQLDASDNNAAELRAVLEAVRAAPAHEPLTVHTDNQAVIAAVGRGRGPEALADLSREVQAEAQARHIPLQARYAPRTGRHMLSAHLLANEARRGGTPGAQPLQTDLLLEQRPALREARVTLRRAAGERTERVTALVSTDPDSETPPSVQVLLWALRLAQPGEAVVVRRASKVAQALWQRPERALRPAVLRQVAQARAEADARQITVQFVGTA